ncbi:MAG: helix-turn-helix transcriptional regulator [Verrucomicrobiota bacterium]
MSEILTVSAKLCAALCVVLREAREEASLSLGEVAKISGLNRQAITFIERGDRKPTTDTIAKLTLALGILPSQAWAKAEQRLKLELPQPIARSGRNQSFPSKRKP